MKRLSIKHVKGKSTQGFLWKTLLKMLQKQLSEVFYKTTVFKKIAKFTEKHLCRSLFLKNYRTRPAFCEYIFHRTPLATVSDTPLKSSVMRMI